jgi:hypothetical protein
MPFKKQLHPTCKHVDLMSLICGKTFLFVAKKEEEEINGYYQNQMPTQQH